MTLHVFFHTLRAIGLGAVISVFLMPGSGMAQDLLPPPSEGQSGASVSEDLPALLVADSIVVTPEAQLVAEGNVEVLFDGRKLRATRVIYDQENDRIQLIGPLRVEDPDGTIFLAREADVDAGFRDGLLKGARVVLDRQLQLAAVQLARVEGRYSVMSRAAITSCQICTDGNPPLWELRARRIVHDEEARQIYLDGAQLRVLDVPVAYVPHLRFPDPTLDRARGFLFPAFRNTSKLGFGIKLPYFIPIGPHKDVTLTPYLSPKTRTLELRYRQVFAAGEITINTAATQDSLRDDAARGYLFAQGAFDIWRDYTLAFDVELTSDEAYLRDYGYSKKGRLDSAISATRVSRDQLSHGSVIHFQTLRDDEDDATQPGIVFDGLHAERLYPSLGGEVRLEASLHGHHRFSDEDVEGRDVYRASTEAIWRNAWLTASGAEFEVQGGLAFDAVRNDQDSQVPADDSAFAPLLSARLSYPMVATDALGARYSLEPVLQVSWTGGTQLETANDESTRSELDEGNLLSLSRFSTTDRRERGGAVVYGLRWAMIAPSGWRTGLSLGQVIRTEEEDDFLPFSGLSNATSDFLLATELGNATGLDFVGRALFDSADGEINRGEARTTWSNATFDLAAAYLLLPEDDRAGRDRRVSEWSFDGGYQVSRHWRASANWHYDLGQDRSSSGGVGLEYQNECVIARFTADRDFADSDNLDPTTTFELTVELKGFATGGDAGGYRRQCSN